MGLWSCWNICKTVFLAGFALPPLFYCTSRMSLFLLSVPLQRKSRNLCTISTGACALSRQNTSGGRQPWNMGRSPRGHSDMNLGESGYIWSSNLTVGCPFLPYIFFCFSWIIGIQKIKGSGDFWSMEAFEITLTIQMKSKMSE